MTRLLLVPAVALTTGWHVIGQGIATGHLTIAAASATAVRPAAIRMRVTASPSVRTVAKYSIHCRKGPRKGKGAGRAIGRTPITQAIALPFAHPAVCTVVASATLPSTTKLTVTILAR
jgi:hypothetical protein